MSTLISLDRLHPHPHNANVMPEPLLHKLARHIARSGRYPPLIVRPLGDEGEYQTLDGHHRALALRRLGRAVASCEVWDVDDAQALIFLATLNRLRGDDDPLRRAGLLAELGMLTQSTPADLEQLLPENAQRIEQLLALRRPAPPPVDPATLPPLPVAVYFFLSADDKRELDTALRDAGGSRDTALMTLVRSCRSRRSRLAF